MVAKLPTAVPGRSRHGGGRLTGYEVAVAASRWDDPFGAEDCSRKEFDSVRTKLFSLRDSVHGVRLLLKCMGDVRDIRTPCNLYRIGMDLKSSHAK